MDCNHECYFSTHPVPFSLAFDEEEVAHPVRILRTTHLRNSLWTRVRERRPTHAFVHTRPMTFFVDVPGMWYDLK